MNFADQKTVEKLRKEFPVGCRIVLDEMDDRQAPPIGTQGTCNGVDDAGNILVSWDTGSHLNVAPGAEQSPTAMTISSRHSAEGRTSRSATAAERRKR